MTTVISVENLSKTYRLGQIGTGTFANDLKLWWAKVRGKSNPFLRIGETDHGNRDGEEIWALRDVSFKVEQGEVLGLIGRNGAGKSTLLKILSRVTAPTSGKIKVKGRVASLLEVGTGFHPELTGRENVYLNGAILGMTKQEVARKFDEIVDFSGVDKFIDTPVKRYSSGMYVRLAFAVAAHLEPEILVVDEVLAVGDAEFQKKCLGKMGEVAHEGRTVLFVSHNMIAMQTLCEQVIWLDSGKIKEYGSVNSIVTTYLRSGLVEKRSSERIWTDVTTAPGNDTVRLHRISISPENGVSGDLLTMDNPIRIEVEYWNLLPAVHLHTTLHFYDEQGVIAFTASAGFDPDPQLHEQPAAGLYLSVCHIPGDLLNSGFHRINVLFIRGINSANFQLNDAVGFDVVDTNERKFAWFGREPGVVQPILKWQTRLLDELM